MYGNAKNILNVHDNTTRVEAHTEANVQWDHSSKCEVGSRGL